MEDGKLLEAEPVSCKAESVDMVEVRSCENFHEELGRI